MNPSELPLTESTESLRERLVDGLAESGYAVFPGLLRAEFAAEVRDEIDGFRKSGAFRSAGIGKGSGNQIAPETRGDGTVWFEPAGLAPAQTKLVRIFSEVREALNAALFLGLWDWEGHYAVYPPGAFYRKHLDRFAADSRRAVSMVFFFNPDWRPEEGGALRLETPGGPVDIAPESGTAVFFLSDRIPHEVIETKRDRYSFAGWFRTRA